MGGPDDGAGRPGERHVGDGDEEDVGEFAMCAGKKGAPLVCVAKDVAAEGERDTSSL